MSNDWIFMEIPKKLSVFSLMSTVEHSKTNFLTKVLTVVLQGVTGTSRFKEKTRKYLAFHIIIPKLRSQFAD